MCNREVLIWEVSSLEKRETGLFKCKVLYLAQVLELRTFSLKDPHVSCGDRFHVWPSMRLIVVWFCSVR
jgi:hypothetical protein